MKWLTATFAVLLLSTLGVGAAATAAAAAAEVEEAEAPTTATVRGEIVDMGCYIGHGATGEGHKKCATSCIARGMPMGLLTEEGVLYLLTMNHDDADPFNAAKDLAAEIVEISGAVHQAGGIKSLEVTDLKPAKAASAEK